MNDQDRRILERILIGDSNNNIIRYIEDKYSAGIILKEASMTPGLIIKYFGFEFYLNGIEELYQNGEEISIYKQKLQNPNIIGVDDAIEIANKNPSSKGIQIYFTRSDFFKIPEEQRKIICNNFDVDRIELKIDELKEMLDNKTTSTVPITIVCRDISELGVDDLEQLKSSFNIKDIRFDAPNLCAEQKYHYSVDDMIKCRTIIDEEILSKVRVPQIKDNKLQQFMIASQVMYLLATYSKYDNEAEKNVQKHKKASNLLGVLFERSGICGGDAETLRNVLACCEIEANIISGFPYNGGAGHFWNEIKLGDDWYNSDLTDARRDICSGRENGGLFANDEAFYSSTDVFYIKNPRTGENAAQCSSHRKYDISKCEKHNCDSPTLLDAAVFFKPSEEILLFKKIPTISMDEYLLSKRKTSKSEISMKSVISNALSKGIAN